MIAGFEYLTDRVIWVLSHMIRVAFPETDGMFDTVTLMNVDSSTQFRIPGRGMSVLHYHPKRHYVLSENMSGATRHRIWDGIERRGAVPDSIRRQMAKMYSQEGMRVLEFEYAATPMQINGFECGDLAIGRAFDLVVSDGQLDLHFIEYASVRELRLHTAICILSGDQGISKDSSSWREYCATYCAGGVSPSMTSLYMKLIACDECKM